MSKKDDCFENLRIRILGLELRPGTELDEVRFCADYGLSRTPFREVLQRLAGEGFVSLEPNRGASVSAMTLDTMRRFFQTAPLVYATMARLAAEQGSHTQLSQLKTAQQTFVRAAGDGDARALAMSNHQFHEIIGKMAQNPYLQSSLNRLLIDHTRMSHRFYHVQTEIDQDRVRKASEQHDQMIIALQERRPEQAAQLTLDHWALSKHQIEKYVWPDPLPMTLTTPSNTGENA